MLVYQNLTQRCPEAEQALIPCLPCSGLWSVSSLGNSGTCQYLVLNCCFLKLKMDADSIGSVFTYGYLSCLDFSLVWVEKGSRGQIITAIYLTLKYMSSIPLPPNQNPGGNTEFYFLGIKFNKNY